MKIGMVGLGRMGGAMSERLMRAGHEVVAYDLNARAVATLVDRGAQGAMTREAVVTALEPPRAIWMMIPAALVDAEIASFEPLLAPGDVIVDGGNSHFRDDIRRAERLSQKGISYMDVGTSGGVQGQVRGYCLMIGGQAQSVARLEPLFRALAPDDGSVASAAVAKQHQEPPEQQRRTSSAARGYLHCGPAGAGHFVKMIHNGIEYGMMAALAEGFNVLAHAGRGRHERSADAETAPLAHPELYQFDFELPDIAELWRHGSIVSSWLLDLTAQAFAREGRLERFAGRVSDSGEGRWTVQAAIDTGVPIPVLASALFSRFSSRGEDLMANRILSALRAEFGGHEERGTPQETQRRGGDSGRAASDEEVDNERSL